MYVVVQVNFILGKFLTSLCFILIIKDYHTEKQREIKIGAKIGVNA